MYEYFTENKELKQSFKRLINNPSKIVLTAHQNPDGDAFGSIFSLYAFFKQMGHEVYAVSPTAHADFLAWMPGVDQVINFENDLERNRAKRIISEADLIFCLDFSVLSRVKDMEEPIKLAKAQKVLIDHHQEPEKFADYIFWNESAAATCELIYKFIEELDLLHLINKDVATCLYTGILTDTGSFKFKSTTKEIHQIAGELIEKGIDPSKINRNLFDQNTLARTRFLGFALFQKLTVLPEFGVAYFVFSKEDQDEFGLKKGDTEGVVNYGLSIAGVNVSVIFIEKEDGIRMSFRSVDEFSVSDFARNHFDGGGHKNAAGGKSNESLSSTVNTFLGLLPTYKSALRSI